MNHCPKCGSSQPGLQKRINESISHKGHIIEYCPDNFHKCICLKTIEVSDNNLINIKAASEYLQKVFTDAGVAAIVSYNNLNYHVEGGLDWCIVKDCWMSTKPGVTVFKCYTYVPGLTVHHAVSSVAATTTVPVTHHTPLNVIGNNEIIFYSSSELSDIEYAIKHGKISAKEFKDAIELEVTRKLKEKLDAEEAKSLGTVKSYAEPRRKIRLE